MNWSLIIIASTIKNLLFPSDSRLAILVRTPAMAFLVFVRAVVKPFNWIKNFWLIIEKVKNVFFELQWYKTYSGYCKFLSKLRLFQQQEKGSLLRNIQNTGRWNNTDLGNRQVSIYWLDIKIIEQKGGLGIKIKSL